MRAALTLAVLVGLLAVLGGCNSTTSCGDIACPAQEPAIFQLACNSDDLKSVVATGPCAMPDASLSSYVGIDRVFVQSESPGVCHVELTFSTGFTYSADVTFTSQPGGVFGGPQCACGDYLGPTSGPLMVNNPSSTCVAVPDAGADEEGAPEGGSSGSGDSGGDIGGDVTSDAPAGG